MDKKNFWIATLLGAVLTTLVSNLPYVGFINCLVCSGFWGTAIFTAWFYRRLSGSLTVRQGIRIGLVTGLMAGLLGFLLSFLGLSGLDGIMGNANRFLSPEDRPDLSTIPLWGELAFNLFGVAMNILFGTLGGFIGGTIFRTDRVKEPKKQSILETAA